MTPEAQRIAIAEACGFTIHRTRIKGPREGIVLVHIFDSCNRPLHPHPCREDSGVIGNLPDYLNDLNAMHEAENTLNPCRVPIDGKYPKGSKLWGEYVLKLLKTSEVHGESPSHASSTVRAEAFLRTLGKWVEEPEPTKP